MHDRSVGGPHGLHGNYWSRVGRGVAAALVGLGFVVLGSWVWEEVTPLLAPLCGIEPAISAAPLMFLGPLLAIVYSFLRVRSPIASTPFTVC